MEARCCHFPNLDVENYGDPLAGNPKDGDVELRPSQNNVYIGNIDQA